MSNFQWYADKYNCSLIEAFNAREEPLTENEIKRMWKEDTGRDITELELEACKPDSQESVNYERSRYCD